MIKLNWNSLPAEILQQIFQLVPVQELTEVALVCKAWLRPAQTLLFSEVYISCPVRLKEFYNNVKHKPQLGNDVKVLVFDEYVIRMPLDYQKTPLELTSLLLECLVNIEVLPDEAFLSYITVLKVLQESGLQRLKRISVPTDRHSDEERVNYVTCVLLAKDRIENLLVSDDCSLYNRLDQLENLTEIEVRQKTNDIVQVLEHVVETSKSLEKVTFNISHNNNISNIDITNCIPRSNIKVLHHSTDEFLHEKALLYIMHKFPRLDSLTLNFPNQENNLYELDAQTLTRLLIYLPTINDYSVTNIHVIDVDIITDAIEDVWEATAIPANREVRFTYSENATRDTLSLFKDKAHITYPAEEVQWEHYDFVQINGKYINQLQIFYQFHVESKSGTLSLPADFITHTLDCCPNLKYLHLFQCSSGSPRSSGLHVENRASLDEFIMNECEMWGGKQKKWSSLLSNIKRLEVGAMDYVSDGTHDLAIIGVNMPYTNM